MWNMFMHLSYVADQAMVKENIRKLYMAMGLQKWIYGLRTVEPTCPENDSSVIADEQPNGPNLADTRYISWLNDHPSAIASFNGMMNSAKGKQIVVFLDYDGTLSPIVNDPDRAFMSDPMRSAVREVARYFPTAIISGRSRDKVYEFVKLDEVFYAGSHGMDIKGPPLNVKSYGEYQISTQDEKGNESTIFQPAKEYLPVIKKMLKELKRRTCDIPGALVEDNRFCISVHYRHVLDEDYGTLEEIVHNLLSEYYSLFHITRGKKVLEIRPTIKWNKGDALTYLLETLGFSNSTNVLPFYLGDDKTDEDAFKVLTNSDNGYPILVSSTPKETLALYSLRDPPEVLSFLIRLARWGETLELP
ncbi:haloacid dehalogenase-like hydrolase superfamily protein [Striga asiatica]|uniref:Trehalose 6-phosphate phosphatase n=1 Tax=Striga asiatica TaxID=4170 RepID=A0A5A7PNV2_STRAF|nr:haloacid dehalogenase-like hydrolase superfamily protein [Striga asiatica]